MGLASIGRCSSCKNQTPSCSDVYCSTCSMEREACYYCGEVIQDGFYYIDKIGKYYDDMIHDLPDYKEELISEKLRLINEYSNKSRIDILQQLKGVDKLDSMVNHITSNNQCPNILYLVAIFSLVCLYYYT